MHDIMVKPLPPGCRLTAIFDVRYPFPPIKVIKINPTLSEVMPLWLRSRYVRITAVVRRADLFVYRFALYLFY